MGQRWEIDTVVKGRQETVGMLSVPDRMHYARNPQGGKMHIAPEKDGATVALCGQVMRDGSWDFGYHWRDDGVCKRCVKKLKERD